jgi:voltage-gated potassium channel
MIALPIGIVANGFSREIHRREFVVTWSMVARVPLFEDLNAGEIADIMRLLRSQTIESGGIIARRGEPAHSMYFIAAGEVEIDLPKQGLRLGAGHFFGEIAVLRRARRSANVSAIGRTNLLVLDAHDFRALMDRQPRLANRVRATASVPSSLPLMATSSPRRSRTPRSRSTAQAFSRQGPRAIRSQLRGIGNQWGRVRRLRIFARGVV